MSLNIRCRVCRRHELMSHTVYDFPQAILQLDIVKRKNKVKSQ